MRNYVIKEQPRLKCRQQVKYSKSFRERRLKSLHRERCTEQDLDNRNAHSPLKIFIDETL